MHLVTNIPDPIADVVVGPVWGHYVVLWRGGGEELWGAVGHSSVK